MDVWEESWTKYGDEAANLLTKYRPLYTKVVRAYARNEWHLEEMYADAVTYRLPHYLNKWDPTVIPSVNTWIVNQIKFHCLKFLYKERLKHERERNEVAPTQLDSPMMHDFKEFSIDLQDVHMTIDERRLLEFRFGQDFSYRELGVWLSVTPYEARKRCEELLSRVRDHFGVGDPA